MYVCVPSVQLYIYTADLGNQFYCNATKQTKTSRNYVSQMYTRTHTHKHIRLSVCLAVCLSVCVCERMLHVFFAAIALVSSALSITTTPALCFYSCVCVWPPVIVIVYVNLGIFSPILYASVAVTASNKLCTKHFRLKCKNN